MHDPHFSFPSEQLFMVLSARGLGKKVVEMVSLDWHYRQGKTVLWESLDKETWSENVWIVSGIEAVCSAWPKISLALLYPENCLGLSVGPWRAQRIIKWVWTWRKFHDWNLLQRQRKSVPFMNKAGTSGKKTKTQWLGASLQGGQNAFKKDQSFCTLFKSMMKVPSEKIALFKLTKQSQAITNLTTKKTFGIKLSK